MIQNFCPTHAGEIRTYQKDHPAIVCLQTARAGVEFDAFCMGFNHVTFEPQISLFREYKPVGLIGMSELPRSLCFN